MERAAGVETLMEKLKGYSGRTLLRKTVCGGLKAALKEAAAKDAICVTGSVFTVGEARRYLVRAVPKRRLQQV
jgi:folylpolyglutamate synthase/dihydropteroate synthase